LRPLDTFPVHQNFWSLCRISHPALSGLFCLH
jgi:hypothetical protein